MDSLKHMYRAMQYIEEHLTEEINYKQIAKRTYRSEYHSASLTFRSEIWIAVLKKQPQVKIEKRKPVFKQRIQNI